MRLLHLHRLSVVFPGRTLFDEISWSIFRGERCGLIGANGAGKTTLLKLMLGEQEASSGEIQRVRDLTVGYLPQEGLQHRGRTLFAEAWSGLPDLPHLEKEIEQLRQQVAETPDDLDIIEHLGALHHRWEDLEGYHAEAKVARVLGGLGFRNADFERAVDEFSGGWQMRIALAKLLLFDPDLLLLDEPTNHLDLPAMMWLEDYLHGYAGSVIMVSHDRRFLDRTVERIAELEQGRLTLYPGSYSAYEVARETRREQREAEAVHVAEERERMERFVARFRYKASKARQVQSRIKMLEKLAPVETQTHSKSVRFHFPPAPPSGRMALEIKAVRKNYGGLQVFDDVNVVLARGEKVALVGVNGAGKSTLCRLIVGVEVPSSGAVVRGHNIEVSYFAQEADFHLDATLSVLEQMEAEGGGGSQGMLRGLLGAFLFSGDDVFKSVSVLSGGEKSRLALAKMLLHPANFIILDEPTNHLDMASQNVLLDALRAYDGTLLVVSHDRYFLDGLVNRVLELDGGTLRDYPGNLSDYLERKGFQAANSKAVESDKIPVAAAAVTGFKSREQKRAEAEIRNRISSSIHTARSEAEALQDTIQAMERRKAEIEALLADENLYRDSEACKQHIAEYNRLRAEIPVLMDEWAAAAQRLEEVQKQKEEALQAFGGEDAA
jgi:ATP-binding cassette, subfamily F, member 3